MSSQLQFKWSPGLKKDVAFCNLETLKKYEPNTYALFRRIEDGERAEDSNYSYRVKSSARFGFSVTRWTKTKTKPSDSDKPTTNYDTDTVTTTTTSTEQPSSKSTGAAEYDVRMNHTQHLLNQLTLLQEIRRKVDALVVSTQESLREASR